MIKSSLFLTVLLLGHLVPAAAETAYVTDRLALGMHRADDDGNPPFRNLTSGTRVDVLERAPGRARIRTPDGAEGWVESAYLVREKPTRIGAAELEARLESYRRSLPLTWVVPALALAFIAGFLGGLWWLDARMRRRHGGFRVY